MIDVRALIHASKPVLRINIFINGRPFDNISLSKAQHNLIRIPLNKELLNSDFLEIVFELPDAHSPKSAGIGDDERQLAIGIERAWFQ